MLWCTLCLLCCWGQDVVKNDFDPNILPLLREIDSDEEKEDGDEEKEDDGRAAAAAAAAAGTGLQLRSRPGGL